MKHISLTAIAAAMIALGGIAYATAVPNITTPLDPGSMQDTLNRLIGQINIAIATGGGSGAGSSGASGAVQTSDGTGLFSNIGVPGAGFGTFMVTPSSANLLTMLGASHTGTGLAVFGTAPTISGLTLSDLAGVGTRCVHVNASGVPSASGADCGGSGSPAGSNGDIQINNTGNFGALTPATGVATFIATPSSANFLATLTTKTGTGLAVFGTSPTITSPTIAALANLTSNGLVKTSGGVGTLGTAVAGTDYAAAPTGAANTPLFNNGAGGFTNGTRSGNTTAVVVKDASTPAANDCAKWDVSGNLTTTGSACGGAGATWNLTDGTHALTNVTALTVDINAYTVGGTAGAATLNPHCPSGVATLGDAGSTIAATNKIARITATLTAARAYQMPAASAYAAGCTLTIVDEARTVSVSNTASLTRAGSDTLNLATTFPAIVAAGFFTTWESDGSGNWTVVTQGVVPALTNGQVVCGTANLTAACTMSGDITIASGGATAIGAAKVTSSMLASGAASTNIGLGRSFAVAKSLDYKAYENNAGVNITGPTTETLVDSCKIPAGAMGATGSVRINTIWTRPASQASTTAVNIKFGAANDLTGTQLFTTNATNAQRSGSIPFLFHNRTASSQLAFGSTANGFQASDVTATAAVNTASDAWLVLSVTPLTGGDAIKLEAFTCEILPPGGN